MQCMFCGEEFEEKELIKGKSGAICTQCTATATDLFRNLHEEEPASCPTPLTLSELKHALDKKVIGQETAKRQLLIEFYKHIKGSQRQKNNIFLMGDSGVGKTHLVRSLSEIFEVPLIEFDATMFSETGYKGKDVSEIIETAYVQCNEDLEQLSRAILFVDEIDKIVTTSNRDGTNKVQQSLLKMVEGMSVTIQGRDDRGRRQNVTIDTRHLQFVVAGACVGLNDQIQKKHSPSRAIGFGSPATVVKSAASLSVQAQDLIDYGFIPEFVGRFPLLVQLDALTKEEVMKILTEGEHSVIRDYIKVFHAENIALEIEEDAIEMMAEQAKDTPLGFRGVQSTLTRRLNELLFDSVEARQAKTILNRNNFIKDDNSLSR